jgi:hypothetical protein
MENRFGEDFGDVRLHDEASDADATKALAAKALTVRNHIVFADGRYTPDTASGKRLLAHELAHVVQQTRRTGAHLSSLQAEREAAQAGEQVASGAPAVVQSAAATGVQREPLDEPEESLEELEARYFGPLNPSARQNLVRAIKAFGGEDPCTDNYEKLYAVYSRLKYGSRSLPADKGPAYRPVSPEQREQARREMKQREDAEYRAAHPTAYDRMVGDMQIIGDAVDPAHVGVMKTFVADALIWRGYSVEEAARAGDAADALAGPVYALAAAKAERGAASGFGPPTPEPGVTQKASTEPPKAPPGSETGAAPTRVDVPAEATPAQPWKPTAADPPNRFTDPNRPRRALPRLEKKRPGELPVTDISKYRNRLSRKGPPPAEPHAQSVPGELAEEAAEHGEVAVGQTHRARGETAGAGMATTAEPTVASGVKRPLRAVGKPGGSKATIASEPKQTPLARSSRPPKASSSTSRAAERRKEIYEQFEDLQREYGQVHEEAPVELEPGEINIDESGRIAELDPGYDPNWEAEGRFDKPAPNKGKWVEGSPGDGLWEPHDPGAYGLERGQSIPFREGVPDLTDYAVPTPSGKPGILEVEGLTGDPRLDYAAAVNELAAREGMTPADCIEWLRKNGLRIHHYGGNEMQIVPKRLHSALKHQGSAVELREKRDIQ